LHSLVLAQDTMIDAAAGIEDDVAVADAATDTAPVEPPSIVAQPHFCPYAELAAAEPLDADLDAEQGNASSPRAALFRAPGLPIRPAVAASHPEDLPPSSDLPLSSCEPEYSCEFEFRCMPEYSNDSGNRPSAASDLVVVPAAPEVPAPTNSQPNSLVGSSPTITLLEEEYRAYDYTQPPVIRIDLLGVRLPKSCQLTSAPNARVVRTGEQHAAAELEVPVACWIDSVVWTGERWLADNGPLRHWFDARIWGEQFAQLSTDAVTSVADWARPAVPILTHSLTPQAPLPAAPQPQFQVSELTMAAAVLHSAAGELESLAGNLRSWGNSLHRVARVGQPIQQR